MSNFSATRAPGVAGGRDRWRAGGRRGVAGVPGRQPLRQQGARLRLRHRRRHMLPLLPSGAPAALLRQCIGDKFFEQDMETVSSRVRKVVNDCASLPAAAVCLTSLDTRCAAKRRKSCAASRTARAARRAIRRSSASVCVPPRCPLAGLEQHHHPVIHVPSAYHLS